MEPAEARRDWAPAAAGGRQGERTLRWGEKLFDTTLVFDAEAAVSILLPEWLSSAEGNLPATKGDSSPGGSVCFH